MQIINLFFIIFSSIFYSHYCVRLQEKQSIDVCSIDWDGSGMYLPDSTENSTNKKVNIKLDSQNIQLDKSYSLDHLHIPLLLYGESSLCLSFSFTQDEKEEIKNICFEDEFELNTLWNQIMKAKLCHNMGTAELRNDTVGKPLVEQDFEQVLQGEDIQQEGITVTVYPNTKGVLPIATLEEQQDTL